MNAQGSLFDVPSERNIEAISGFKCKDCAFIYDHQYGKMKYCSKKPLRNGRTSYGDTKVTARQPACNLFEKFNPLKNH
jgi:rubredoxin